MSETSAINAGLTSWKSTKGDFEISKQDAYNPAQTEIRALRSQSNAAIARHEAGVAVAIMRDDVKIIASSGRFIDGAPAMAQAFETIFSDPDFVTFVREPQSIEIGNSTAVEVGRWDGRRRTGVVRGAYMVRWQCDEVGWRIAAELYVPLVADSEQAAFG